MGTASSRIDLLEDVNDSFSSSKIVVELCILYDWPLLIGAPEESTKF